MGIYFFHELYNPKMFCNLDVKRKFYMFKVFCRPEYDLNIFVLDSIAIKNFEIAYIKGTKNILPLSFLQATNLLYIIQT